MAFIYLFYFLLDRNNQIIIARTFETNGARVSSGGSTVTSIPKHVFLNFQCFNFNVAIFQANLFFWRFGFGLVEKQEKDFRIYTKMKFFMHGGEKEKAYILKKYIILQNLRFISFIVRQFNYHVVHIVRAIYINNMHWYDYYIIIFEILQTHTISNQYFYFSTKKIINTKAKTLKNSWQ